MGGGSEMKLVPACFLNKMGFTPHDDNVVIIRGSERNLLKRNCHLFLREPYSHLQLGRRTKKDLSTDCRKQNLSKRKCMSSNSSLFFMLKKE